MRQSIKTIAAAFLLSMGATTFSFAQDMAAITPVQHATGELHRVETLAEANFSNLFPNASQQKWSISAGNSFVSFLNDGRKATASFNAKGEMNYVITQCVLNNLPEAFSKTIKAGYAAYQLYNATEIKAHGETAYQAVLENAAGFVTLKFTTDGVEEIQRVKK